MTRLVGTLVALLVTVVALTAVLVPTSGAIAPVPRTCWWSDYVRVQLSNKCDYRHDERRWYMRVGSEMKPADEQELEVANLCLYFHGTECPE